MTDRPPLKKEAEEWLFKKRDERAEEARWAKEDAELKSLEVAGLEMLISGIELMLKNNDAARERNRRDLNWYTHQLERVRKLREMALETSKAAQERLMLIETFIREPTKENAQAFCDGDMQLKRWCIRYSAKRARDAKSKP